MPIAQLTSVYYNSQKTKPPYSSPKDFCLFTPKDKRLSSQLCDCWQELINEELIPTWAAPLAPEELDKYVTGGKVAKPRLWMASEVVLVSPRVQGGLVTIAMAILDGGCLLGEREVFDIDSGESFIITIPRVQDQVLFEEIWGIRVDESTKLEE